MTYLIPTISQLILLVFCASLVIQTLSRLGELSERVLTLSKADAELLACAQRDANLQNIDDSYAFLVSRFPKFVEELQTTKHSLKSILQIHENSCMHAIFSSIHSAPHYQVNANYPLNWPNWVLGIKGVPE